MRRFCNSSLNAAVESTDKPCRYGGIACYNSVNRLLASSSEKGETRVIFS